MLSLIAVPYFKKKEKFLSVRIPIELQVICVCSGGGPVVTMETSWFEKYCCSGCGKKFKAMGKKPACSSCRSEDVTRLSD
jgi:hypothetical protein